MSRYELPGKLPGHTVAVGLDRPMQEWFFQLYTPDSDEDEGPAIWRNTRSHNEICALMREHCDLGDPLTARVMDAIGGDLDPDDVLGRDTT